MVELQSKYTEVVESQGLHVYWEMINDYDKMVALPELAQFAADEKIMIGVNLQNFTTEIKENLNKYLH